MLKSNKPKRKARHEPSHIPECRMPRERYLPRLAHWRLGAPTGDNGNTNSDSGSNSNSYQQVDAEAAKELMDTEDDYVILDARTQTEYDEGHIPGAILIPHDTVATAAENALPDKDQLILVYCRSGNRSKEASQALVDLGYTNVVEFGGINSWPYEVEK